VEHDFVAWEGFASTAEVELPTGGFGRDGRYDDF